MTLDQLAIKYGSDKSSQWHGYCDFYEKYLPKDPKRILEIGVKEGKSLAMWLDYFPDAFIHGLDLFQENTSLQVRESLSSWLGYESDYAERLILHQGDQRDWQILEELRKYDFDVIIDDGSHNSRDQMMTFFGLFNGKHYFIEDLHCCFESFYQDGLPHAATALGLFNSIHDSSTDLETITGKNITLIHALESNQPS